MSVHDIQWLHALRRIQSIPKAASTARKATTIKVALKGDRRRSTGTEFSRSKAKPGRMASSKARTRATNETMAMNRRRASIKPSSANGEAITPGYHAVLQTKLTRLGRRSRVAGRCRRRAVAYHTRAGVTE